MATTTKIAISIDKKVLKGIDQLVEKKLFTTWFLMLKLKMRYF